MKIVFHLGPPCTDEGMLISSLSRNKASLSKNGVAVPDPKKYRALILEAMRRLKGARAPEALEAGIIDEILGDEIAETMILSDPNFICLNRAVFSRAQIWPMVERISTALRHVFPSASCEFAIGIRNPATLLPALFKASRFSDFNEFAKDVQPQGIAWSETLIRLRQAQPDCPITVWCNEDTPLIWGDVLRAVSGADPASKIKGADDVLAKLMPKEGYKRMVGWLREHNPKSPALQRRVRIAFLERYAMDQAMQEEITIPEWSDDLVAEMTARYDEDSAQITAIPGVRFLSP